VVHQGAGEEVETLSSWLTDQYPDITKLPWPDKVRIGIVHRLDKDTSGLIVLAKNPGALEKLQNLFQNHQVEKKYLALVFGKLEKTEGEIEGLIGRDPHARRQQTSSAIHFDFQPGKVRESKTHYQVIKEYRYKKYDLSLVEATLDTGRMHQIRVHFKSIGCPVIGDPIYNIKHSRIASKALGLNRQFLHSHKISFKNPFDDKQIELEIDLPTDLKDIIKLLDQS
jgi:23S rRNA pseudouridine1911/1915/1917 synthase